MFRSYVAPPHVAALAQRLGATVDTFTVAPTAVDETIHADFTAGAGTVSLARVSPRELRVSADCDRDARVRIGQVYSPLWRLVPAPEPEPSSLPRLDSSEEGLIEVLLTRGHHDFGLVFDVGPSERWGEIVSLLSVLIALGALAVRSRA
jgi:hypothetical protein